MKIQVLLGKGEENSKGREGTGKCRAGRDTNIKKRHSYEDRLPMDRRTCKIQEYHYKINGVWVWLHVPAFYLRY